MSPLIWEINLKGSQLDLKRLMQVSNFQSMTFVVFKISDNPGPGAYNQTHFTANGNSQVGKFKRAQGGTWRVEIQPGKQRTDLPKSGTKPSPCAYNVQ